MTVESCIDNAGEGESLKIALDCISSICVLSGSNDATCMEEGIKEKDDITVAGLLRTLFAPKL